MSKTLNWEKPKSILIPNNTNCQVVKKNKSTGCPYGQR